MHRGAIRLSLLIESDSEPISGVLEGPGPEIQPFVGWVALVAALEAATATAHDRHQPHQKETTP